MGWNPFKKKSWDKVGKGIEREAGKAKRELEKAAKDARKEAERAALETRKAAEKAAKETEKLAKEAAKEAERLARQAEDFFTEEARQVVQRIFDQAKDELVDFAEGAVKDVKEAFTKELPALAETAFKESKEALTEELPAMAEMAIKEAQKALLREATRKALNTAVDLIDTIMPDSLGLTLGPVNIQIGDVFDKVEAIKQIAEHPPDDCDSITEAVKALAPDEISIDLSIGVGFIVQSDSAQVGVSLGWSKESVLEHLPALLKKCGVPD